MHGIVFPTSSAAAGAWGSTSSFNPSNLAWRLAGSLTPDVPPAPDAPGGAVDGDAGFAAHAGRQRCHFDLEHQRLRSAHTVCRRREALGVHTHAQVHSHTARPPHVHRARISHALHAHRAPATRRPPPTLTVFTRMRSGLRSALNLGRPREAGLVEGDAALQAALQTERQRWAAERQMLLTDCTTIRAEAQALTERLDGWSSLVRDLFFYGGLHGR